MSGLDMMLETEIEAECRMIERILYQLKCKDVTPDIEPPKDYTLENVVSWRRKLEDLQRRLRGV